MGDFEDEVSDKSPKNSKHRSHHLKEINPQEPRVCWSCASSDRFVLSDSSIAVFLPRANPRNTLPCSKGSAGDTSSGAAFPLYRRRPILTDDRCKPKSEEACSQY